jgi:hypothetical protein
MAIDSNIALGFRGPQIEPQSNALMRAIEVQGAMQRTRANDMAFEEKERARDRQNRLDQLLAGGAGEQELLRGGFITESTNLAESRAKAAKAAAEQQAKELEAAGKRINLIGQVLGASRDQSTWDQGRAFLQQQGIDVAAFPAQFDAQGVRYATEQAIDAAKRIDQALAERQFGETTRANQERERVARGQLGVAQGNLSVARDRLAFDREFPVMAVTETATGPVLVDPRGRGPARPVMGADGKPLAGKPQVPTEGQASAQGFVTRMIGAENIITGQGAAAQETPSIAETVVSGVPFVGNKAANFVRSPDRQMTRNAQEEWVRAKLRKESGAAIPTDEMDREIETYFPQIGETDQRVIEQKRALRKTATDALLLGAGPSFKAPPMAQRKAGAAPPAAQLPPGFSIEPVNE